jgi:hypothetical protein
MKSESEQLAMFKRIADGDFRPNENGLFDIAQVAHLVAKRGCTIHNADDYGCEIRFPGRFVGNLATASIMATDKGLWHPINIFRACRDAAGQPHYEIDYAKAKIKNPGNLNEVLIAQIVGADGVRPYLSRRGQYEVGTNEREGFLRWNNPRWRNGPDLFIYDFPKAEVGSWTWPMFCIVGIAGKVASNVAGAGKFYDYGRAGKSPAYRRAVRALDDAGLLKLTVGPRGGFGTATFEWLPAAYLAPIQAPKLDHADAEYLTDLMAVS